MNAKSILLGVALASLPLFAANRVEPVNLYVSEKGDWNPEGSEYSYMTIQEAVAAATVAGDVVWVDDGFVCTEEATTSYASAKTMIIIKKAITLRSKSGYVDEAAKKGATIRGLGETTPASTATRVLGIEGGAKVIGFVIEDGCSGVSAGNYGGGGIRMADCVVSNCVIRNCHGSTGGGVRGSGTLYSCVITNNATTSGGAGVYASGTLKCYDCTISDNVAQGSAGGVYGATMLSHCTIACNQQYQNSSGGGGGGVFLTADNQCVVDCTITGNVARSYGGGIYAKNLAAVVIGGTVGWNSCGRDPDGGLGNYHLGGGIYGGTDAKLVVSNCIVAGNTGYSASASSEGGGIYGAKVWGGLVCGNTAYSGGGCASCVLTDVRVLDNTGTYQGGGIVNSVATNCWIAGNEITVQNTTLGGGGASNCDLVGCVVSNNTAVGFGGGVYVTQAKTIERCEVVDNVLTGTSGNSSGGGIYAPVAIDIRNCLVARNESSSNTSAGGVIGSDKAPCRLINCTVVENNGNRYGDRNSSVGGVRNVNIVNTIVWGNVGKLGDVSSVFSATNCCVKADLSALGPGNISDDPKLSSDLAHRYWLTARSPCRGTGYSESGEPVDMGAFPYMPLSGLMLLVK